jgi:hypothetical protein
MVAEPAIPETAAPPAEVQASLRFVGRDLDPGRISDILGVKPTAERWPDTLEKNGPRRYPFGMWRLDSPLPPTASLIEHLVWLLEQLTPIAENLRLLHELTGYRGSLYCGYFFSDDQGGQIALPPGILATIATLGVALDIRVYDDRDPTADANTAPSH